MNLFDFQFDFIKWIGLNDWVRPTMFVSLRDHWPFIRKKDYESAKFMIKSHIETILEDFLRTFIAHLNYTPTRCRTYAKFRIVWYGQLLWIELIWNGYWVHELSSRNYSILRSLSELCRRVIRVFVIYPILFTVLVSPRISNVCSNILSGSWIGSFWLWSSSIVLSLLGSSFDSCSIIFIGFTSGFPVIDL